MHPPGTRTSRFQLNPLPTDLPPRPVNLDFITNSKPIPLGIPNQDLELNPGLHPDPKRHLRPVRHRLRSLPPRKPIRGEQLSAASLLVAALVELWDGEVGNRGSGGVEEDGEVDVGVMHSFVVHGVLELEVEEDGVVVGVHGGEVESRDVEVLNGAGGIGGAEG